ncbi:hypothetical protein TRICI_001606 [Trichomonascus ciferrii]|uniref:Bax inhibitor 1 n=1 Tax=Trichomonascus ciferrii TaxID=44093 RepID=A0A642V8T2_9ASCO|nr:hypothetical protein TRICI_001606 [Trichomonascus ciferrii]
MSHNDSSYPVPPPRYSESRVQPEEAASPLLGGREEAAAVRPGEGSGVPREEGDHVPDDFKYADKVAECTLPIRQAFIRKVYSILTVQLLVTAAVGTVISMNPGVKNWALSHIWAFYVSMFGAMGFMIGAFIKQRSYPTNLIFLGGFTLLESYAVGTVSSLYDTRIVLQAVALTFVIFLGVSIFAIQTRYDLTGWAGYLNIALWGLIGFGLVAIFVPFGSKVELIYSSIGALVFTGYILVDTQLILKKFHPEDEVAAAVSLYLDIINLFLNILRILNEIQNDN